MTPAVEFAKKRSIQYSVLEYKHDPKATSYGLEAAEKLNLPPQRVFKTLVVSLPNKGLAVAVLPVTDMLNMKQVAKSLGDKKAIMADPKLVERTTGYVLGGVSPLGQKKRLPTVVDQTALLYESIYVSAGRRGLEIELSGNDLINCTNATLASICE